MIESTKSNPPIPSCKKCGSILPKFWREYFCSVECYAGDDPDD